MCVNLCTPPFSSIFLTSVCHLQISLGDARSYYLSTAKNEHGVIYAQSVAGVPMTPISWNQMMCPKTRAVEFRKVAKTNFAASTVASAAKQ